MGARSRLVVAGSRILCCLLLLIGSGFSLQARAQDTHAEIVKQLKAINQLTLEALEASRRAEAASSVADVKTQTETVFEAVWGMPSGLVDEKARGAENVHGWKTRWQVDTDDFELETPEKFGVMPPEITDPALLGIEGRGRYVRKLLWESADSSDASFPHYGHVVASLSNVIGWMRIGYAESRGGMPRVDLTYQWDAPSEFWISSADTGWILDAYAQALNILKTDYDGDAATARRHAADMTRLIQKALDGEDANGNGTVEPAQMEGGLTIALQHAGLAGFAVE
jgi:hypothetical protein